MIRCFVERLSLESSTVRKQRLDASELRVRSNSASMTNILRVDRAPETLAEKYEKRDNEEKKLIKNKRAVSQQRSRRCVNTCTIPELKLFRCQD